MKTIRYIAAVGATGYDTLDLWNAVAGGSFHGGAQTLYVDNSGNPRAFAAVTSNELQRIICPAFSQGFFPILQPNPAALVFASAGSVNVPLMICDRLMPAAVWFSPALGIGLQREVGGDILLESGAAMLPEG